MSEQLPAVFSIEAALERVAGDASFLAELVELASVDADERFVAIRMAIGRDDAVAVANEAHSIKGAFLNVGAERAAYWAQKLEHGAKFEEGAAQYQTILPHLESDWQQFRLAFQEFQNSKGGGR